MSRFTEWVRWLSEARRIHGWKAGTTWDLAEEVWDREYGVEGGPVAAFLAGHSPDRYARKAVVKKGGLPDAVSPGTCGRRTRRGGIVGRGQSKSRLADTIEVPVFAGRGGRISLAPWLCSWPPSFKGGLTR